MAWLKTGNIRGPTGESGQAAFTLSTQDFEIPPIGETVEVDAENTDWIAIGEWVYIGISEEDCIALQVAAKTSTSVTLLNVPSSVGIPGPPGLAATLAVGQTITGIPGSPANVVNVGDTTTAIFDFTIPEGLKGDKGDKGDTGDKGDIGDTGPVSFPDAPSDNSYYGRVNGVWSKVLPISGGTMTGSLYMPSGKVFQANSGASIVNASGAYITNYGQWWIENGATVSYKSGARLNIWGGATVSLEANSSLVIAGRLTFTLSGGFIGQATGGTFEVKAPSSSYQSFLTFHIPGAFACNFGMDTVGNYYIGGWSLGTNAVFKLWTTRDFTNNPSDYRVKKDIVDLQGMWETVKKLRPIKYTHKDFTPLGIMESHLKEGYTSPEPFFKGDNIERWGFVAHELQETLVDSVAHCPKDDPNLIQSPNLLTVIAALTKALQEAMARIETLEAQLC